jgi:2-dehydropantoate 2-reductase
MVVYLGAMAESPSSRSGPVRPGAAPLRTLILGSGAVGGFFGGRLAQAGEAVVFVARGRTFEALRRDGLRIESAGGVARLQPISAVEQPRDAGRCDVVLVCVKSPQTAAAVELLRPIVDAATIVLSLQNGVENEAQLASGLGLPPLLGAIAHIGAEMTAPGVVRHDSGGRIVFGEADGTRSARVARLVELFTRAAIDHRVSGNIAVMLWDKLAWNAPFNSLSALTRLTVGELLADAAHRATLRAAMLEVVAVARAGGVGLEAARVDDILEHSAHALAPLRTSMLQDVERGRSLEREALTGAVLRAAARAGVAVPVIRQLDARLARLAPPGG